MKIQGDFFSCRFIGCVLSLLLILPGTARSNVYVIVYTSGPEKNGHAALAVDKYEIQVREDCNGQEYSDTVRKGELLYYELMPSPSVNMRKHFGRDIEGVYHRLPAASNEKKLDLDHLLNTGTPYKKLIAPDGLIEIPTSAGQDEALIRYLDSLGESAHPFNSRYFNCTDFICQAIGFVSKQSFRAKEFVPFSFSSTPNKLFRKLSAQKKIKVNVLKDAGKAAHSSFLSSRVWPQFKKSIHL